jgi:thiamine transporter
MFTDPFETLSLFDKVATIALYVTIGVIALVALTLILVKKLKPDYMRKTVVIVGSATIVYTLAMLATLLGLKLQEYLLEGYIDYLTFIPVVVLVLVVAVLAVVGFYLALKKKEALPLFSKISGGIVSLALLALIVSTLVKTYVEGGEIDVTGEVLLYLFTAILVAIIAVLALLFGKKKSFDTKSIVYASVSVAMSFALSYIRFLELPQGGSITFASLVPLMIYSYMFGIRKGVVVGIIYGFLQFIQAPWFYHPLQFLLDYPIAFASIGLAGILNERNVLPKMKPLQFALGGLIAVTIRYLSHVVSGIFVFGSGDPNYGAVAWSFLYNAFTYADLAVCLVAGCSLFASKTFLRLVDKV